MTDVDDQDTVVATAPSSAIESSSQSPRHEESLPCVASKGNAKVLEILATMHFDTRMDEIEVRVAELLRQLAQAQTSGIDKDSGKISTIATRNTMRRRLHGESELLRVEIEEQFNEAGMDKLFPSAKELQRPMERLDNVRKQLRLEVLPMTNSMEEKVFLIFRFVTLLVVFFFLFGWCILLVPLRWLNAWLLQNGLNKEYLPMDLVSSMASLFISTSGGTIASVKGRKHLRGHKDLKILTFSHGSNLDAFIVGWNSPIAFNFVGKKSLFMIPVAGWLMAWGFGYTSIDRSHRENAVKALADAAAAMQSDNRWLAISPEGTRSKDGLIQDFKKGPFYLVEATHKSIVPVIVYGAYELWPPGRLFSLPGRTFVRFLPEFVPDPQKNKNLNRLALRRIFLQAYGEEVPADTGCRADANLLLRIGLVLYLMWAITFKLLGFSWSIFWGICAWTGMSAMSVIYLHVLVLMAIEVVMYLTW